MSAQCLIIASPDDEQLAGELASKLGANRIKIDYALTKIDSSTQSAVGFAQSVASSDHILLLWTDFATKIDEFTHLWQSCIKEGKPLAILQFAPFALPSRVEQVASIDFRDSFQEGLYDLHSYLKQFPYPGKAIYEQLSEGQAALQVGNLDQVLHAVDKILSQVTYHKDALLLRAKVRIEKGKHTEALFDLETIQQVGHADAEVYYLLGVCHDALGYFEDALDAYTAAMVQNPRLIAPFLARAKLYDLLNEPDLAIQDYGSVLALDPEQSKQVAAYALRGSLYLRLHNLGCAASDLDNAVRLDPRNPFARLHRAKLRKRRGDLAGALEDCNATIQLEPQENSDVYLLRSQILQQMNRIDEAFSDAQHALRVDPSNGDAYDQRGILHCARQDFASALSDLDKAIHYRPFQAKYYRDRGIIYQQRKQYDEALLDYQQAIDLNSHYAEVYFLIGITYMEQQAYDAARDALQIATQLAPQDAEAFHYLGQVNHLQRNLNEAITAFNNAIANDPTNAEVFQAAVVAYRQRNLPGDAERASEYFAHYRQLTRNGKHGH